MEKLPIKSGLTLDEALSEARLNGAIVGRVMTPWVELQKRETICRIDTKTGEILGDFQCGIGDMNAHDYQVLGYPNAGARNDVTGVDRAVFPKIAELAARSLAVPAGFPPPPVEDHEAFNALFELLEGTGIDALQIKSFAAQIDPAYSTAIRPGPRFAAPNDPPSQPPPQAKNPEECLPPVPQPQPEEKKE